MPGRVVSVNVGLPADLHGEKDVVQSGIVKRPVDGAVMVRRLNVDGDGQADLKVHGGPDRAVYVYSADDYAWWSAELGEPLEPGRFGENLTVTGLRDADVHVGQRIRVGGAVLQATTPREPCFKLGRRMGDPHFPKRFLAAARMGFYARVVEEGPVAAGDPVEALPAPDGAVTIAQVHHTYVHGRRDRSALGLLAATPGLPDEWRDWALERMVELGDS